MEHKRAESCVEAVNLAATRGLPIATGVSLGYLFAPESMSKLLLGLPPVHASTALWIVATGIAWSQLRALLALASLSRDESTDQHALKSALRSHPALGNPFSEIPGPMGGLVAVVGPMVLATTSVVALFVGMQQFYFVLMPVLLPKGGSAPGLIVASYFIGQGAFLSASFLLVQSYRQLTTLVRFAASTPDVASAKVQALSSVLFIASGGTVAWIIVSYFVPLLKSW
ncbi:MAG: hypothetical protein U0164_20785 [Gemmatimonadaceae bacterium]